MIMTSSTPIEDYFEILEVAHEATVEVIVKSYKRLALKLHPDRNARHDATAAFQRVCLVRRTWEHTLG
jgi:curved DNA-binding protein CbpA